MDDGRALDLSRRIAAARTQLEGSIQLLEDSCSRLQATRQKISAGRSQRELLYTSGYARLQARLETMPVIEQAKGVLMAQTGCGAQEAFDMLRRASQRSNTRVRDLAGEIVSRAGTPRGARAMVQDRGESGQGRTRATQDRTANGQAQRRPR
jgi:hypothetical protein